MPPADRNIKECHLRFEIAFKFFSCRIFLAVTLLSVHEGFLYSRKGSFMCSAQLDIRLRRNVK